ncbi:MAG: hypothetical protein AAF611_06695 [Bacteroidota bacterium]
MPNERAYMLHLMVDLVCYDCLMPRSLHTYYTKFSKDTAFIKKLLFVLCANLFIMLQWSCAPESEQLIVKKGTLDLSTADFSKNPEILLQGEGLLY